MDTVAFEKSTIWRLRSSYITTIISISLVLFITGIMGLLLINARHISDYVKENIGFSVILGNEIKEVEVRQLQKKLDAEAYVKATKYINAEEAAEEMIAQLGEDFVDFLGYNPLMATIDVQLHANYSNVDSITVIESALLKDEHVKDVFYQENLIHLVNKNVRKISMYLAIFSILLLIVAAALINNTIRLSVYSKRFLIHTKKLVGATQAFIRKPFLLNGAISGAVGAALAMFLLLILVSGLHKDFARLIQLSDLLLLYALLTGLGVLIAGVSTYFAVNKYLNLQGNALYYQ